MQQAAKSRETGRYWQICDTAAHIFAKKGYERTSLDDVAAELNITKPGLYYYFRSKDELLYKIIQYHWDNLYQPIKKKLEECDDPVEIIRFAIAQHFGYVLKNPEGTVLVEEKYSLREDYLRAYKKQEKEYADAIRAQITKLKQKGRLRKGIDPTVASYNLFSMINMTHRWYKPGGRLAPEKVTDQLATIFFEGILG